MMDSHELPRQPRGAMNSDGGGGGGGGGVRRRPPTATPTASSSTYGTNEEDALLSSHNEEEGYPVLQSYTTRRRSSGAYYPAPWYRQPQKLILGATLCWVGGVMYLASLAHAILRTHKETANNMMGISSMVENNNHGDFKEFLASNNKQGMLERKSSHKYGEKASDEDVKRFLETYNYNNNNYGYGASDSASASNVGNNIADADVPPRLNSQQAKKYSSTSTNTNNGGSDYEDFQQWLESQAGVKTYGASAQTNEDFQQWLESRNTQNSNNKYGSSRGGSANAVDSELGDAWQDWLASLQQEKSGYGASSSSANGNSNGSGSGSGRSGNKAKDVNVRFGSMNNGANAPQEWLEYQAMNKNVKYNANGNMYGNPNLAASLAETNALSSSADQQQQQQDEQPPPPAASTSDSSMISTIDWPLQGLASHESCTTSSGCSPSTNVTVLIVYGPEYHTHISEMAWNVATGVHAAFQSHIRHHPSSPLHGHIVYGHTSNLTFLDVMDADAIIVGSPVYNGNVHPDIQNWINYWHIDADLSNKFGGAFATAGGIHAGADGTIMSILRSMMVFQMMAVGGDSWTSPFGAVATMYEDPFGDTQRTEYFDNGCYYTADDGRTGDHLVHPYFLRKAYGLGERIANVSVAWKNSSYVRWN